MSTKFLWTGLTLIVAVEPFLKALGVSGGGSALIMAGGVIMMIGLILLLLDR